MMETESPLLLDTNIVVLVVRGKVVGQELKRRFFSATGSDQSYLSVVSVGELYALSRKLNWGQHKIDAMHDLLSQMTWLDINHPAVLDAYAELDAFTERSSRVIGKNDLWIAAQASVTGATLLTTDTDFDHFLPEQLTRIRIDQRTGQTVS